MSDLHRYEIETHGGGSTSIGAVSEVAAVLNLIAAQADAVRQRDERLADERSHRRTPARDLIANLPKRITHAAICRCQGPAAVKAEELFA